MAALKRLLAEHNAEQAPSAWPGRTESPVNIDKTLLDADAPDNEYIDFPN